MKLMGKQLKTLWADESAQGATEYILLLVAIVALVFMFKDKLLGNGGVVSQMLGGLQDKVTDALK